MHGASTSTGGRLTPTLAYSLWQNGGKGANLGEMAAAGFPVPPGFCLTTTAFRRFVAACPDADAVYARLDALTSEDLGEASRVGEQVRSALLATPIPDEVAQAVVTAWRATGEEHIYAVRSSATAEDLPQASFAGQQDTYLNVHGKEALLDGIRRCWVSLFTDRAILYRIQQGFSHREVQLAVVVQRMVMSETSGILFTADPVTGHRHTLVINASFGLGEALVAGLVTPDAYRVDKRTRAILERRIADKQIAILPEKDGGTRQASLPPEQRRQPALSDEQILALTDLGCRVENHYGQPQDMEWAIAPTPTPPPSAGEGPTERLYLLQTRPITSLYPIDCLTSPDGSLRIFFSLGHQQGMTRAMAPLSLSSFPLLLPIARAADGFHSTIIRVSGGRMFADITPLLRHPVGKRLVFALTSQFDVLAPRMIQALMRHPEFRLARPVHVPLSTIPFLLRILRRVVAALWLRDLTGFLERTNALMDDFVVDVHRRLQATPPGKSQLQTVLDILPTMASFFLNWVPEAAAGIGATRLLSRLARRYLSPVETDALTLGIPGNVVNEMNLAIGDLTDLARQSPALVAHFAHLDGDVHAWLDQAAALPDAGPFLKAWGTFLDRYGARGPSEIDIMQPRWAEDPLPVLRVIAGHLQQDGNSRARFEAQAWAREAALLICKTSPAAASWDGCDCRCSAGFTT